MSNVQARRAAHFAGEKGARGGGEGQGARARTGDFADCRLAYLDVRFSSSCRRESKSPIRNRSRALSQFPPLSASEAPAAFFPIAPCQRRLFLCPIPHHKRRSFRLLAPIRDPRRHRPPFDSPHLAHRALALGADAVQSLGRQQRRRDPRRACHRCKRRGKDGARQGGGAAHERG